MWVTAGASEVGDGDDALPLPPPPLLVRWRDERAKDLWSNFMRTRSSVPWFAAGRGAQGGGGGGGGGDAWCGLASLEAAQHEIHYTHLLHLSDLHPRPRRLRLRCRVSRRFVVLSRKKCECR